MSRSCHRQRTVFFFGGQGSQYHHMAADLFAADAVFRDWMLEGDRLLRNRHGLSVLAAIYDSAVRATEPFDRLEVTHPAVFLVQYALAQSLRAKGVEPDLMLGVSLGEFVAMAVAEMISFEAALDAVAALPPLLRAGCEPGGMIAVAPSTLGEVPELARRSEIAGVGSGKTFVLTAPAGELLAIEQILRERRVTFQRMPVPLAFHSRWIEPAEDTCRAMFANVELGRPRIPCLSSSAPAPVDAGTPDLLWRTLRAQMSVGARIAELEAQGGAVYVDLSPTGANAALARQSFVKGTASRLAPVVSPFGGNVNRLASVISRLLLDEGGWDASSDLPGADVQRGHGPGSISRR
jgi:bacillaene synthase trans-acting acyltransferase